jgi:thiamine-monophosphate kinase
MAGDWSLPMASGDDYELCFTLPSELCAHIEPLARRLGCPLTPIGRITDGGELVYRKADGAVWIPESPGYEHFAGRGSG